MRTGESLRAMSDADIFRILSEQEPDFSAKICEGLTIEDLDKEAIAEMKTQYTPPPIFQINVFSSGKRVIMLCLFKFYMVFAFA